MFLTILNRISHLRWMWLQMENPRRFLKVLFGRTSVVPITPVGGCDFRRMNRDALGLYFKIFFNNSSVFKLF